MFWFVNLGNWLNSTVILVPMMSLKGNVDDWFCIRGKALAPLESWVNSVLGRQALPWLPGSEVWDLEQVILCVYSCGMYQQHKMLSTG